MLQEIKKDRDNRGLSEWVRDRKILLLHVRLIYPCYIHGINYLLRDCNAFPLNIALRRMRGDCMQVELSLKNKEKEKKRSRIFSRSPSIQ